MQKEREKLVKELAKDCTSVEDVHEKLRCYESLYLTLNHNKNHPF